MLTTQIHSLFTLFKTAIQTTNVEQLQACYHIPCTLNTPDSFTLINNDVELIAALNAIVEQLQQEQFSQVAVENMSYSKLGNNLYLVSMDWTFTDIANQVFSEFSAFYHLILVDKQLKIINATSHQITNSQQLAKPIALKA